MLYFSVWAATGRERESQFAVGEYHRQRSSEDRLRDARHDDDGREIGRRSVTAAGGATWRWVPRLPQHPRVGPDAQLHDELAVRLQRPAVHEQSAIQEPAERRIHRQRISK